MMYRYILLSLFYLLIGKTSIQASEDAINFSRIQIWLEECHRARAQSNEPLSVIELVYNEKDEFSDVLPECASPALSKGVANFSVFSSSSTQSEVAAPVNERLQQCSSDLPGFSPKKFVKIIQTPESWQSLLEDTSWKEDPSLFTKEHYQQLHEQYIQYLGSFPYKAKVESSDLASSTNSNEINGIIVNGQKLLRHFEVKFGSLK